MEQQKQKASRLRFTYEDDLALLTEFLSVNPIVNPHGWEEIQENILITMGKKFLIKTLKQHLQLLIEVFLKKIKVDDIKSGIEEPYCQKNALLYEVSSLVREHNYDFKQKRNVSAEQRSAALGKQAREDCAQAYGKAQEAEAREDQDCTQTYGMAQESEAGNDYLETYGNEQEAEIVPEKPTIVAEYTDHNYFFVGDINEEIVVDSLVVDKNKENHASVSLTRGPPSCTTPATSKINCNVPQSQTKKVLGPRRSRIKKGVLLKRDALSYLTERNTQENERKSKELKLEERKISVEEKKILLEQKVLELKEKEMDLHHKEVMTKLEIEKKRADVEVEEKKLTNQLMQSQQKLIDQLFQRLDTVNARG